MRAIRYRSYGTSDELRLEDVPVPRLAGGQVLVRVACAALNPKDFLLRAGKFRPLSGRNFPKLTGLDFAGEVQESLCSEYRPGDSVFGFLNEWQGRRGTLADVVTAEHSELAHLPATVSAEQGAAVALVGTTCLQALRDIGHVTAGTELLIHGASGGLGTVAIQIGRLLGARVTTISSDGSRALCTELGAADARSYQQLDLQRELARFHCVFDVFGSLSGRVLRRAMRPGSCFISTAPSWTRLIRSVATRFSTVHERVVMVRPRSNDLKQLADWLASGQLRAVVDTRFSLQQVRQAFQSLEGRHAHGKVMIDLS